jgi:hypothetical protein
LLLPLSFYVVFVLSFDGGCVASDLLYQIRENFGKFMIVIGVLMIIVGVSFFSTTGSVISAASLFFGFLLFIFGFFFLLGVFSGGFRSIDGLGMLFVCFSIVLIVFGLVIMQFQEINVVGYVQEVFKGGRLPFYRLIIATDRPYLWLSDVCLHVGLCLFLIGLAFKAFSFFKG